MKCSRCGFDVPAGTRFCGRCAAPIPAENGTSVPTETLRTPIRELACDNAKDRMADVPHAERIVEDSTQKFLAWLAGLAHVDTLKSLHERFEKARRDEIERYAGKLSRLAPEDRVVVERMTETLLQKILHNPTIGLKEGDASERLTRAAVVRALFKLDDGA